ncbi:AGAP007486-PA-like protein [Anopheles sinensis]|uniref:AGAP007486-PA-like protein n=1 Tax=Anopheles sinensis TaxID=74873 RepID=A0A084WNB1_ANOSI|nr:AGAP007486-PA-like protein [Anopheles sinensis]
MSSARCLNWSRPPPGRHPALRKQVSCSVEPSSSAYSSATPPAPASVSSGQTGRLGRTASLPGPEDFCHQFLVTGAIIHTNRFQNYHTYDQARRGGSASLVRQRTIVSDASGGQLRRPASASVGQPRTASQPERSRGAVLCKQLSLDQSILVQSSFASGMATVASGGGGEQGVEAALLAGDVGERSAWSGFNRKQQQRVGAGIKTDADLAGCKKGLKTGGGGGGKDSRINIKIFLGQTVQQQDSSDTGVSDTEGTTPGGPAMMHQHNVSQIGQKPAGMPAPSNVVSILTAGKR